MPDSPYRPRLSIDLSMEQRKRLDELLPWGTNKKVFTYLVDVLINFLESNRDGTGLGAILTGKKIKLTLDKQNGND